MAQQITPTSATDGVLNMDQGVQVQTIKVDQVGICTPAPDFISLVCGKTRVEAQTCIANILKSKDAAEAAQILCRKAEVPGYLTPTYVITYEECLELLTFLPRKRVRGILQHIDRQFARLRTGDQALHSEIDARAASNDAEAQMARSSLGMQLQHAEDPETQAIKKRRLLAEVERLELENARQTRDTFRDLFGGMDARDEIMLKDKLMNALYGTGAAAAAITNSSNSTREEVTIDDVIKAAGMRPSHGVRVQIGKLVAKAYRERYNKEPPTCKRYVDGAQREVKSYLKADEPWMLDIARVYKQDMYKIDDEE